MSRGTRRKGPAPRGRRRPQSAGATVWRRLADVAAWIGIALLAVSFVVLAIPTVLGAREVLSGSSTGSAAILHLATLVAAEVVVVLMGVLALYAAVPQRVRLTPRTVRTLGTLSFGGLFFFILLVLRGELFAVAPVLVYFLQIRRALADELPLFAGGRLKPERKSRRGEEVIRRPPRSWDEPAAGRASGAGGAKAAAGRGRGKTAAAGSGGRKRKKKRRGKSGSRAKGG